MGRKKKTNEIRLPSCDIEQLQQQYVDELETNPVYSLEVDPTDIYNMTEEQKRFILNFVQYKSVATAAEMINLDPAIAKEYFQRFETQQEIRRLNSALYYRQFSAKLLDLDSIGGYLSSLLMDQNIPYADRLKTNEKLRVAELIIKINEMKRASFEDPAIIMGKDISTEIRDLSVGTIKKLLAESNSDEKSKLIEQIGGSDGLTIEESSYLQTLPIHELLQIIEKNKHSGGNNDE